MSQFLTLEPVLAELRATGWSVIASVAKADLLRIMRGLGDLVLQPRTESPWKVLRPAESGICGTFTARFGLGAFPPHTDGAHVQVPPRFIALRVGGSAGTAVPTRIARPRLDDLDRRELGVLMRASWRVRGPAGAFLAPLVEPRNNERGYRIRFDPLRMHPLHSECGHALQLLSQLTFSSRVEPSLGPVGSAIILDNWRVLHWRGPVPAEEVNSRVLERIVVR